MKGCTCGVVGVPPAMCRVHPPALPPQVGMPQDEAEFNGTMAQSFGASGLFELFLLPDGIVVDPEDFGRTIKHRA